MIGLDGSHAPTRPEPPAREGPRGKGEWKEVKGFRLYLLDSDHIIHLISWHQIKSDKELRTVVVTYNPATARKKLYTLQSKLETIRQ